MTCIADLWSRRSMREVGEKSAACILSQWPSPFYAQIFQSFFHVCFEAFQQYITRFLDLFVVEEEEKGDGGERSTWLCISLDIIAVDKICLYSVCA